jgi:hypothetical protein
VKFGPQRKIIKGIDEDKKKENNNCPNGRLLLSEWQAGAFRGKYKQKYIQ